MQDKVCLVTGATAGIGLVTARELARRARGSMVVGRSLEKCARAVEEIKAQTGSIAVEPMVADLSSQADIRRLAEEVKSRTPRLDVLVNNAGGIFLQRQESVDGIEMTFAPQPPLVFPAHEPALAAAETKLAGTHRQRGFRCPQGRFAGL